MPVRPGRRGYAYDVKILAISDVVEPLLYGANLSFYTAGVEAVISCGDLPFEYLEYVVTFSGAPLYYVRGNHDPAEDAKAPGGCISLDGRVLDIGGLTVAGLSGSRWYSGGPNQHTEKEMRRRGFLLSAKITLGEFWGRDKPDVFVTHASPRGLGDREDPAHEGFETFLSLIDRHEPPLWLHGHVHLYGPEVGSLRVTKRGKTRVVNAYGHQVLEVGELRRSAAGEVASSKMRL
jgi:Icc-related predicted phosphoesterase